MGYNTFVMKHEIRLKALEALQRLQDDISSGEIEAISFVQREGAILPVGRVVLSLELEYDRKGQG